MISSILEPLEKFDVNLICRETSYLTSLSNAYFPSETYNVRLVEETREVSIVALLL